MHLFFIVYEEVLEEEIAALLDRLSFERYIRWEEVKGKWEEKHMGTHVWPGEYHTVLVVVKEDEVERLKNEIKDLRERFPADELWVWKTGLEEMF